MTVKAAFVGATGATLSHVLAWTLMAGHKAAALVRDATKLRKMLISYDVPESVIDTNLAIVEGPSSRSVHACVELLRHDPEIIFSRITALPKFQLNPFKPVPMQDLTITGDSAAAVIEALHQLKNAGAINNSPVFVPISSSGQDIKRDQPLVMIPLYIWLLHAPQADTTAMEKAIKKCATEPGSPLGGYVMKGLESLRVGWTVEDAGLIEGAAHEPGVTVGYTISRLDLANWMFKELIQGNVLALKGK
ncbi:hypothetical protein CGCA056_v011368 [Colletotrichum aenigma]|uniref:uncharacterized protein n=1 Tax=Colletotrichum aenigma TaxID=1215731 RepID=UPI00187269B5|nr:uncharacterized protein CGCA056_v011368 [Colletotrichum aenigma]KAF5517541.1 hypothetical protein CGCA056_v011368 [Colletotrichum aenigma]